jgi:hypothetical protein
MNTESNHKNNPDKNTLPAKSLPQPIRPLTNYSLSTICPSCGAPTIRHACKVRCPRCGFMWDCSEL